MSKGKLIAIISAAIIVFCGLLGGIAYQVLNNMHAFTNYHEADKSIDGYFENVDNPKLCGKYTGNFQDGLYEDKGVFIYCNGDTYDGSWHEG
ncbi:MAG: hypothetical protein LBB10_01885 [Bifidobacteriaceae bacterium]|nr:hypothetical protein [Bifidobacteriaceae bacterium]